MEQENVVRDKSYHLALRILKLIKKFTKSTEGFVVGNQLLKSGTSIGANIEEAIAAFSKHDFIYKMSLALKEARETHYWLRLIHDSRIILDDIENLKSDGYELI